MKQKNKESAQTLMFKEQQSEKINSFPRRKITPEQLKKDLEKLELEVK